MGRAPTGHPGGTPLRESPAESERRDHELLQRGTVAFRVAVVQTRAFSAGVGLRPGAGCLARAIDLGYPIVRRSTGGTGVLLEEGDVTWAVILPRSDRRIGPTLLSAYASLGEPLVRYLGGCGVEARWAPSVGDSRECCLLGGRGRVLTGPAGLLSGAAQHLTREGLLHHGTLPRTIDRKAHRAIFAEDDPSAFERLVGTRDVGVNDDPESVRDGLASAFETFLARP